MLQTCNICETEYVANNNVVANHTISTKIDKLIKLHCLILTHLTIQNLAHSSISSEFDFELEYKLSPVWSIQFQVAQGIPSLIYSPFYAQKKSTKLW